MKVMMSNRARSIRQLETLSVNQAVNGSLVRIREGKAAKDEGFTQGNMMDSALFAFEDVLIFSTYFETLVIKDVYM